MSSSNPNEIAEAFFTLVPYDVCLFRDYRPFNMSDNQHANSGYEWPSNFAGMLKTAVLFEILNQHNLTLDQIRNQQIQQHLRLIGYQANDINAPLRPDINAPLRPDFCVKLVIYIRFNEEGEIQQCYFPMPRDIFKWDSYIASCRPRVCERPVTKSLPGRGTPRASDPGMMRGCLQSLPPNDNALRDYITKKVKPSWILPRLPLQIVFSPENFDVKPIADQYSHLDIQGACHYLKGNTPPQDNYCGHFFVKENRAQIFIKDRQRKYVGDDALFSVRYHRLAPYFGYGMIVTYPKVHKDWIEQFQIGKLGGEMKTTRIRFFNELPKMLVTLWERQRQIITNINDSAEKSSNKPKRIKIYFLSPVVITALNTEEITQSIQLAIQDPEHQLEDLTIEGMFLGKPMILGGYDLANDREKPRTLCYPAGSVLHLSYSKGKLKSPLDLHLPFQYSSNPHYSPENGFGAFLIANECSPKKITKGG